MATNSIRAGAHGRSLRSSHAAWATAYGGYQVSCNPEHLTTDKLVVSTAKVVSYSIARTFLAFDTSSLANQGIKSAKLRLWVAAVDSQALISIHITQGVQPDPIGPDTALQYFNAAWLAQNDYGTDGGSILLSDLVADQYNDIDLNAAGLAWLEQAGGILSQYESMDYKLNMYADFFVDPNTYQFCQTFTPRVGHTVKKVKLRLVKRGALTPPDITIDIMATDPVTFKPTGPVLATGTILGADIDQTSWGEWVECDLGAGTPLTAETLYAIVVSGEVGSTNPTAWAGSTGSAYTRGALWYSGDEGATWLLVAANYDCAFSEYGSDIDGGTLLVLRTTYDYGNSAPPSVVASAEFYAAQHGDDYAPVLEVETYDNGPILEVAFGQAAFTAEPSWTDVSSYLKSLSTKRGRQHTLGRIEAGVATFVLDNAAGDWWRGNTDGAFYPYVKPLCLARLGHRYGVNVRELWWGVVEGIRPDWVAAAEAGLNPVAVLECVDMFKSFSRYKIEDANPALTTFAAVGQKELTVDSTWRLFVGQSVKIYDDAASEVNYIASIDTSTGVVTMLNNLAHTYETGRNAKLKKFPSVLSGTRINDVLCELGWPLAMSAVDAGQVTLVEFSPPTGGTNCLEHMQRAAECERGVIFMRAADGYFVFQDLIARAVQPLSVSQFTFTDDDSDSKYVHPELSDDDTFIYNEAMVSGDSITTFNIKDTVAQAAQGPRVLTMKDSLFALDSDALNYVWIAVARFADSILRVKSLLCKPSASPDDLYPKLMGHDISTRLTFLLNSVANPAEISQEYHIEGIEHEWDALTDEWVTKWQLWEVNQYRIAAISADGFVELTSSTTYAELHDAVFGDIVFNNVEVVEAGQWLVHALASPYGYVSGRIQRGLMEFDTSGLAADDTIDQGILMLKLYAAYAQAGNWDLVLVDPSAVVSSPLELGDYIVLETRQTSLGSLTIDGTTGWAVITLNSAGLAQVSKGGTTKLALRSQHDIDSNDPGVAGNKRDYVTIYGKGSGYEPRLILRIA